MIDIKELRIGNWVYENHLGKKDTVASIYSNGYVQLNVMRSSSNLDYISPISLTPEILEKCGFVKLSYNRGNAKTTYIYGGAFEICFASNNHITTYICATNSEYDIKVNCKYLHQLQNIFYDLTGKELEINL